MRERWHGAPKSADENEINAVEILKSYGFDGAVRLPGYVLDIRMMREGKNHGYTEVKGRINLSTKSYPTLLVELPKVNAGYEHSARLRCVFWIAVPYTEGWHWVDMQTATQLFLKDGGRYDRNDRYDWGKMVHIPIHNFFPTEVFMERHGFKKKEIAHESKEHDPVRLPQVPNEIQERVTNDRRDLFS